MVRTPLYDKLAGIAGARMGEYRGVETALAFGDARAEFTVLLRDCGVYDLGWRAHFCVSGRDRARWLNGMVSNNIRDLPAGHGNYNFLLNAQGRILGDMYVYNRGENFIASSECAQLKNLLKLLRKYIIMDQVELTDLSGELTAIGVQGPGTRHVLARANFEEPLPEPMELREIPWCGRNVLVTRMAPERSEAYEIWMARAAAPELWDMLAGATLASASGAGAEPAPVGMEALEMFRVAAGIPRYGRDIRERELPQETAQMQALNFSKGCYIGQEIVERIRSRGNVHRTFTGLLVEGSTPATGAKVQDNGKDVGEITSALLAPASKGDRVLALGYVRREVAKPGYNVQVDGRAAVTSELPFPEIFR